MSRRGRTAIKFLILAAPAILLLTPLSLWGQPLSHWVAKLFAPPGHVVALGPHTVTLPGVEWEKPIMRFFETFPDRLSLDNPFRNDEKSPVRVKRPLAPLTQGMKIFFTQDLDVFQREAQVKTGSKLPFSEGYFYWPANEIGIYAGGKTPQAVLPALSHELTHAMMRYSFAEDPRFSPWLAEGVAQWCETDRPQNQLGFKDLGRLRRVSEEFRPGGLAGLVRADLSRFQGEANRWYYDGAYALVCFLLETPDLRQKFIDYYDEEAGPDQPDREALFKRTIGEFEPIELRWAQWLKAQR